MKIIIFQMKGPTSDGVTGGAEKYSEELANVLEQMDFTVEIYCGREKDEDNLPAFERRTEKITVRRFDSLFHFLPLSIFSMHWYYLTKGRESTAYIIENQSVIPLFTTFYKKSIFTIIHHLTGKDYIRKQGRIKGSIGIILEDKLMPLLYRQQNILTVSEHSKKSIVAVGLNEKKIDIIPPIVQRNEAKIPYSDQRENIIAYIGRYTGKNGNKRVDAIIEVMPEVIKKIPDARLIIGGSIKKKEELLGLINQYNLQEAVAFKGFLSDSEKAHLLADSKIFASPSYQEGFGITYIEAQGYGTPVVGYEIKGLETVPKTAGFMVEKDDKEALTKAIIELLENKSLWHSMSQGALKNAAFYEVSSIQNKYKLYIEKMLAQRK